ncbi:MAG: DMT family transporter [Capsulimonas sp.]|uniref:DMT family transporter n=1 Tax=Capsulimonas sp. TaxID=2494211 RepID=UPI0032647CCA
MQRNAVRRDPSDPPDPAQPAPPSAVAPRVTPVAALLLIAINMIWGASSFAGKRAMDGGFPPMMLAFARFTLSAVLMYGVAGVCKVDLRVARRDWGRFWAMGVLGLALTYLLYYAGLKHTTVANASLLMATEPVYLAILSWILLREPMPLTKALGIAAGLAGVLLIVSHGDSLLHWSGGELGGLTIALALTFEALSSIVGKKLVSRYPPMAVITYQMAAGAIALTPFALWELFTSAKPIVLTTGALWSFAYLVIPCTVLAYTIWFTLIKRIQVSEISVFLFAQPLFGALIGAVVLHDAITPQAILGATLVVLAIGLIQRRRPGA